VGQCIDGGVPSESENGGWGKVVNAFNLSDSLIYLFIYVFWYFLAKVSMAVSMPISKRDVRVYAYVHCTSIPLSLSFSPYSSQTLPI